MLNYLNILKKIIFFLIIVFVNYLSITNFVFANKGVNKNQYYDISFLKGKYLKNKNYFLAGIKFDLMPGWKIYWKNPGDAGLPPEINSSKLNNTKKIELLFPEPKSFKFFDLSTFGYDNEVIFPIKLYINDFKKKLDGILIINAQICNKICIPIKKEILINFFPNNYENKSNLNLIGNYLIKVPDNSISIDKFYKNIEINSDYIYIDLNNNISKYKLIIEDASGFIFKDSFLHHNNTKNNLKIKVPSNLKPNFKNNKLRLTFFSDVKKVTHEFDNYIFWNEKDNFINILLIALLGGFILNLMPCVLPILSLKLINIISFSSENPNLIKKRILYQISGVIFSFIVLAIFVIILKAFGNSLIWGFQFQNDYFLLILSLVVILFGLNLFGLFEFSLPFKLNQSLNKIKSEKFEDFLSGCLMTILATPCTAPFIGTAVMYAFTGNVFEIFMIFSFMSFGLSIPLVLILFKPNLILFLPKSGKWLIFFKKIMASLFIISGLWFLLIYLNYDFYKINRNNLENKIEWVSWNLKEDPNLIKNLVSKNKVVFLDITADWCITCKYNKAFILNDNVIIKTINKNEVVMLQLDWTKKNKDIEEFILKKNRYGIPYNEIYNNMYKNGYILPELLDKNLIINLVNNNKRSGDD